MRMSDAREIVIAALADLGVDSADADIDLLDAGLLDSLGLVSLIAELEERMDIHIPFEELGIDDFRTIKSITGVVEGRRDGAEAGGDPPSTREGVEAS
jgi:D-alanine--poly(phosphoribitol) ligase subunit 2